MKMPTSIMETAFKSVLEETTKINQKVNGAAVATAAPLTPSIPGSSEQIEGFGLQPKHLLIAVGIGLTIWIVYEMIKKRQAQENTKFNY